MRLPLGWDRAPRGSARSSRRRCGHCRRSDRGSASGYALGLTSTITSWSRNTTTACCTPWSMNGRGAPEGAHGGDPALGRRVAAHARSFMVGGTTTIEEHRPSAPAAPGRDAGQDRPLGPERRRAHRGGGAVDPLEQAAPRAGIPLLPGHPAPGHGLRRRARRGRLRPAALHGRTPRDLRVGPPSTALRHHRAEGVGKTYLACALAHNACRDGHRVRNWSAPKLERELASSPSRRCTTLSATPRRPTPS